VVEEDGVAGGTDVWIGVGEALEDDDGRGVTSGGEELEVGGVDGKLCGEGDGDKKEATVGNCEE